MRGQPLANHAHVSLKVLQPVLVIDRCRWMEGGANHEVPRLVQLSAQLSHALLGTQHKLRGKVAQADDDVRPDGTSTPQSPLAAGCDLRADGI